MNLQNFLSTLIKTCDIHERWLGLLLPDVEKIIPLSNYDMDNSPIKEFALLEAFSARFAKMQDLIGSKIFPTILKLSGFYEDQDTFRDYLSKLERLGVIPSVAFWQEIRDVRNEFAHDYPDDSSLAAKKMNDCFDKAKDLLSFWQEFKAYVNDHNIII